MFLSVGFLGVLFCWVCIEGVVKSLTWDLGQQAHAESSRAAIERCRQQLRIFPRSEDLPRPIPRGESGIFVYADSAWQEALLKSGGCAEGPDLARHAGRGDGGDQEPGNRPSGSASASLELAKKRARETPRS